jgi:hypothetical protein
MTRRSALASWTPEQIEAGRRWVNAWRSAARDLEAIRRKELREVDGFRAIALLCGPTNYLEPPRLAKPTSGLVEQQRIFRRARTLSP